MEPQALSIVAARGSSGQARVLAVDRLGEAEWLAAAGALLGQGIGDGLVESIVE